MINHKHNYHGHTYLCGHASGTPLEYTQKALKLGYKTLGFSEHAPMPNLRSTGSRLELKNYNLYFDLIKEAKDFAKDQLTIYTGFEIEYFDFLDSKYSLYKKYLKDVEYLILGQHYIISNNDVKSVYEFDSIKDIEIYAKTILKALPTKYFNLLAHIDLCFYNIKNPTGEMYELLRPILKLAKSLNIPLELNANGIRRSLYEKNNTNPLNFKYPTLKMLEMFKEENVDVIITSDAHHVKDLYDFAIEKSYELAKEYNLNIISELKMNYYK